MPSLPKQSVIICFVDESWSALLRSVWSVLNRTPRETIEEILLVDDGSSAEWLGGVGVPKLRSYIESDFPKDVKIKVITSDKRLGLIRARLLGASKAVGPVLTFLDSHIECNQRWAEPILQIIGQNRKTVVTPVIDTIEFKTMAHAAYSQRVPAVGTFSWTMDFSWKGGEIKPGDKLTDPVDSPTMAGGLFSIDRDYFYEIGSYDELMDGWGGENLEMSFRIWQCHGRLVTAPCSHIGHIFRESHPYSIPGTTIHDTFTRNSIRVAEVWMDEYKDYFYATRPGLRKIDFGDVTDRRALRDKLQCKPFRWYMNSLLPRMFVPDAKHIKMQGAVENPDGQCLDKMGQKSGGKVGVYFCHGMGGNQAFMYTTLLEIRVEDDLCLDAWGRIPSDVHLQSCHGQQGNQAWYFSEGDGTIRHADPASPNCLESYLSSGGKVLKLNTCSGAPSQTWHWNTAAPKES